MCVFYEEQYVMASSLPKGSYDLTHQQNDVLDYITEIAQELASMAARAGCDALSYDLKQAVMKAHGMGEKTPGEGIATSNEEASHKRL
jgi:hypothetical protein